MKAIPLVPAIETIDLTTLTDTDLQAFFGQCGLDIQVVTHCDDPACPLCFAPAKAA